MPRKPKFIHPLRAARAAMGPQYSQEKFSKLVGTSKATIQSIELGRLAMSKRLALRICAATGLDPASIQSKKGKPMGVDGKAFTQEGFKEIQKRRKLPDELIQSCIAQSSLYLETLMECGQDEGKFTQLLCSFEEWLNMARTEFGLEASTLEKFKKKTRRELPSRNKGKKPAITYQYWTGPRNFIISPQEREESERFLKQIKKAD